LSKKKEKLREKELTKFMNKYVKLLINRKIEAETDSGYQDIKSFHKNSKLPKKKPKNGKLTSEEKAENHQISESRISNEHAIGFLKRFRILSERYRNRRKRFGLRLNLIVSICNSASFYIWLLVSQEV
jgi:hypothetical protein